MKRVMLAVLATGLLLASCGDKNAYTIKGTTDNTEEGLKAYLTKDFGRTFIDSSLVKDGQFGFSGVIEESEGLLLAVLDQQKEFACNPVLVILEPGDITVAIKDKKGVASGTALNDAHVALEKKTEALGSEEEKVAFIKQSAKENSSNALGEYLLEQLCYMLPPAEVLEVVASMPEKMQNKESIKSIKKIAEAEVSFVSNVGQMYKDIKGLTIDGKEAALSDYAGKGKVVLLDFWASWCGPCIQELPHVKAAYEKYKNKGFDIVGVSLDDNHEAWKKATEKHEIKWPQFSNLKAWDEPAGQIYGVKGIPHTVLIDKDGMVIDEQLRGEKLLTKLGELLDK